MIPPKYAKFLKQYDTLNANHNDGLVTDAEFVNELLDLTTAFCAKNKPQKLKEHDHVIDIDDPEDPDEPDDFMVVFD
jgi:hypothetical protein